MKWPNDLLINNKKISGVLIETIDMDGKLGLVIGIGINIHMSQEEGKDIDQSWVSLDGISNKINDRNEILGDLISGISVMTEDFSRKGFKAFKADFEKLDLLIGKKCKVEIKGTDKIVEASGINDKGELVVKDNLEYLTLRYGEVSIREL